MNFSELPTSLRRILAVALLLVAAIGAGAFTLSFVALREVAAQPQAGWGPLAFLFPLIIDGLLVAAELVLVAASMLGRERLLPLGFVLGAGAVTIWFNITRVPAPVRPVTAIPPIASIGATILIAYLVKILAVALGKPLTYVPPPPQAGYLLPPQTVVTRLPDGSYGLPGSPIPGYGPGLPGGWPAHGQMPSANGPGNPQLGPAAVDEATKRRAVEMYLSGLPAEQLGVATGSSVVVGVAAQGIALDERYARRILDEWKAAHKAPNGARQPRKR